MSKKSPPDWEKIEFDYRAGIKTLREIADEHGITHGAVNKRAKAKGWSRDLAAKIRAKAHEKVSKALVSTEVSNQRAVTEQVVVEFNAAAVASVLMEHRKGIKRGREIFGALLAEVEFQTGDPGLFEQLGDMLDQSDDGDENGKARADKLNEIYRKVISTPGRVESARKLVEMLERVVKLERQAFNIDQQAPPENELTALLKQVAGTTLPIVHDLPEDD